MYVDSTGKLVYRNDVGSGHTVISTTNVTNGVWHDIQAHVFINGATSQTEVYRRARRSAGPYQEQRRDRPDDRGDPVGSLSPSQYGHAPGRVDDKGRLELVTLPSVGELDLPAIMPTFDNRPGTRRHGDAAPEPRSGLTSRAGQHRVEASPVEMPALSVAG